MHSSTVGGVRRSLFFLYEVLSLITSPIERTKTQGAFTVERASSFSVSKSSGLEVRHQTYPS
jgi:hypothetical protein